MPTQEITAGQASGSLIAIVFGVVFIEVNSGGLGSPWPIVLRVAGGVLAVALIAALFRRGRPTGGADSTFFGDRRYWWIVLVEAVALFGGLAVINAVLHHGEVAVAWIAVVVGVHFFGLGVAFHLIRFHVLGAVMTVLGVAGFVLGAAGAGVATIGLVSGVLSGVALLATAATITYPAAERSAR